jgi:hypothetical protein
VRADGEFVPLLDEGPPLDDEFLKQQLQPLDVPSANSKRTPPLLSYALPRRILRRLFEKGAQPLRRSLRREPPPPPLTSFCPFSKLGDRARTDGARFSRGVEESALLGESVPEPADAGIGDLGGGMSIPDGREICATRALNLRRTAESAAAVAASCSKMESTERPSVWTPREALAALESAADKPLRVPMSISIAAAGGGGHGRVRKETALSRPETCWPMRV